MTSQQSSQTEGYTGYAQPNSHSSDLNAIAFVFQMLMGKVRTAMMVKVVSVTNAGGLEPVGYVDVQPMVNQTDGAMNAVPHGVVPGLPYFRLQGGANAVIMDPEVGDTGVAVFADRDISTVKATKATANPGSKRRFDMADGLYIGGFLNGAPTQVIQFTNAGINITSPTAVNVTAPAIVLTGAIVLDGPVTSGTCLLYTSDAADE